MSSKTNGCVLTTAAARHRRAAVAALAVSLPFAFLAPAGASTAAPTAPAPDQQAAAPSQSAHLDLGAQDLPETRTVTTLAPGLTRTAITRGEPNQDFFWTAEVAVPSTSPDPDAPASALSTQAQAQMVADKLNTAGVTARVEHVQSPSWPTPAATSATGSAPDSSPQRPMEPPP
ncbi:hypothetical protein ACFFGR_18095 [Arthrobacter liuii]|uniref:Uncharacterized protein n=1 Tax=Arthrobacter liuii TaxID=1476996 RepID=A0ABQ2AXG2_9MICC|nr:hypothetical protein [Arthrobacter liuii]GGH97214.1 hypothetical protein GCM10007170_26900 [Arthrobacter liuii]